MGDEKTNVGAPGAAKMNIEDQKSGKFLTENRYFNTLEQAKEWCGTGHYEFKNHKGSTMLRSADNSRIVSFVTGDRGIAQVAVFYEDAEVDEDEDVDEY